MPIRPVNNRHRHQVRVVRPSPNAREAKQGLVVIKAPWKERMHFKDYRESMAPYTNNTAYVCSQWDWYYKMRAEAI